MTMEKYGISEKDPAVNRKNTIKCPVCDTSFDKSCQRCPYCDWKPGKQIPRSERG